jgi:eight-cysteine-cluster-containing protein
MKKQIIFIYIAVALVLFIAIYKNSQKAVDIDDKQNTPISQDQKDNNKAGIANPASQFCKDNGGQPEIRTNEDGSQYGVCIFKNGVECDEWDFFSGRCSKDGEDFCGQSTNGSCKGSSDCVEDGCSGQICRSKTEDGTMTTCEMKSCYENNKYGLTCQCKNSQCQWSK